MLLPVLPIRPITSPRLTTCPLWTGILSGRRYTLELRTRQGETAQYENALFAVAAGLKPLDVGGDEKTAEGGESGPVIDPDDTENSLLVKIQTGTSQHFGQFTPGELDLVMQWIREGAKEK